MVINSSKLTFPVLKNLLFSTIYKNIHFLPFFTLFLTTLALPVLTNSVTTNFLNSAEHSLSGMSIDFALTVSVGFPAVPAVPFPLVEGLVDLAVSLDFCFEVPPTIAFSLSSFRDLLGISVASDANVLGDPSRLTAF